MEGVFLRKKFNAWLFLLLLCGLVFIGMYIFLGIVDSEATSGLLAFLIAGILICLVVIPSWLLNFKAFIRIDEDSIKAKYHWFGKIDCTFSDVTFAAARVNTLIIQLKSGKTHTIMGIENPWALCSIIRRNMDFDVTETPETLNKKLNNLKVAKKHGLIYVCSGLALMFINIFIAVLLTGERELYVFSKTDWTIMAVMGVIEIATIIATFYFAEKTGKKNIPIERLRYQLQRRIVESYPLLPGLVIAVYADENYTRRITLFRYPNDASGYYAVEEFASDYNFIKVYESEIYEDIELLSESLELLIDITEKVLY